ncbi:unnamed protein product [Schistosoma margrebowiei]|uniref:Uncharacterized protein n=1 Tax=Schistosoma margrebowiei TaxID=48269 RepID=A0A183MV22_9TREM|nr:unnamed protein product [Schistosoma margrebowiei]
MKSKLKKHWTMGRTTSQMFNTPFLRNTEKLNKPKIVLSNRFQTFHDLLNGEGTTMESNRKGINETITSICHEVLNHKKHHHREWITVDTLDKIQERRNKKAAINTSQTRAEKAKAQAEYTEVNKQVKSSIRNDKSKYVENLAMTVEKAARERNMRQLYDTTKKLSGNHRKPERPVKNKEGKKSASRWRKHGIQWTDIMQLDDIDFADDLALLSQTQQQMLEKTNSVAAASVEVGLNIHKARSKIPRHNTACNNRITLDGDDLEDVNTFTYLDSIIDEQGECDEDMNARIGKARAVHLQLKKIWNSKQLSVNQHQG